MPRQALLVVAASFTAIGMFQANQTPLKPPLQDDSDIVAVVGSEAGATSLVSAILRDLTLADSPVFVLDRQIRASWLPRIEGVEFVRLSDAEAAARTSACGNYWFVTVERVERTGDVEVFRRRTCTAGGNSKEFAQQEGEWRQTRTGTASGWVFGPPPECLACLQRQ